MKTIPRSSLAVYALCFSLTAFAGELPPVSLETAHWSCGDGASLANGVATLTGRQNGYCRVTLPISRQVAAGKTLRLSAEVHALAMRAREALSYASPKLKVVDGANNAVLGVNNFGATDRPRWEPVSVDAKIPAADGDKPVILELGLQLCDGTLEVRNVTLAIVPPWAWRVLDAGAEAADGASRASVGPTPAAPARRPNVLFIAFDDLKPELNCYGSKQIISPNLDRLAASGVMFTRTYCQQAVCSPSRTSLLTGLRPDGTRVYDLVTHFRDNVPDVIALPQHFALNGYATMGMGKIYHGGLDDKASWNTPAPRVNGAGYVSAEVCAEQARRRDEGRKKGLKGSALHNYSAGPPVECADVPDKTYYDGALADAAVSALGTLSAGDRPFFLAVGFHKPHLPFTAPKRYWDLYQRDALALADNPDAPAGVPPIAMHTFGELRAYQGIPAKGPLSEDQARELIHGYYACVSFVDAQVGRVLDALDARGLRDKTIVILWGDHGWHLGDHGLWCKHTDFESATRVPMLVRVPWAGTAGKACDALTEFVDIYPSLCELAGLPVPVHCEGTSFAPLIADPERPWKTAAFSQYPRGNVMGYSMRTDRYRYTEWIRAGGSLEGTELYDHWNDPEENVNLAAQPAHRDLLKTLGAKLHRGWRGARPGQ